MSDRIADELPSDLPEWMRTAAKAALQSPVARSSVSSLRNRPEWPLFLEAAVVQSFLPRQLPAASLEGEARESAERTLLRYAETVHSREGTKWALTQQARSEVLNAALQEGWMAVSSAIERTAAEFTDPVSKALRTCLRDVSPPGLPADLQSLEALRVARGLLNDVENVTKEGLDELDRAVDLRRLLAPFERMIGETISADGARRNQFFGRAEETETLRAHVGEIAAASFKANISRLGQGLARQFRGVRPLVVWGVGGVGKTTLIAKFMLEHARVAQSRFPFAYLDFDRPTISARNLSAIFSEICVQVAAQFPGIARPLDELRDRADEIRRVGSPSAELSELLPCLHKFRTTMDEHLASEESVLEFARPFLLVFDTFEVAQYDPDSIGDLADFVSGFTPPDGPSLWPRLRVIISGRQRIAEFAGPVQDVEIGALDRDGSIDMLMSLAQGAGKPIERPQAQRLIAEIVKVLREKSNKGVDPLRLRLIGATFGEPDAPDGPRHVESLISELRRPISVAGISGRAWVDGLLVRRVLDHVKDRRVRALADPGLVVRHITPDVIRDVMTVATPDPAAVTRDIEDATAFEPWRVSDAEAADIFAAFEREVSLVSPRGDALRHRQDVRRQMLPLIRARRPNRFRYINELAFQYFGERARQNPKDHASAAEAIYHGLWLGVADKPWLLEELESLWRGPDFEPRIDIDEFASQPDAARFLRMKTGQRLSTEDVQRLPADGVRSWLTSRLGTFIKEVSPERTLDVIRKVVGEHFDGLWDDPQTAAVVVRLLYRTGRWDEACTLAWHFLSDPGRSYQRPSLMMHESEATKQKSGGVPRSADEALLSLTRTWVTIGTKAAISLAEVSTMAYRATDSTDDPVVRVELFAYGSIATARNRAQQFASAFGVAADRVPAGVWRREAWILRLAILSVGAPAHRLVHTFIQSSTGFPRERLAMEAIETLLELVHRSAVDIDPDWDLGRIRRLVSSRNHDPSRFDELDDLLRQQRKDFRNALLESLENAQSTDLIRALQIVATFDHSDWHNVFANALTRALKSEHASYVSRALSRHELSRGKRGNSRSTGHAIVRDAIAHGRFLDLAAALADIPSPSGDLRAPNDVVTIARALLGWHERLVELVKSSPERGTNFFA